MVSNKSFPWSLAPVERFVMVRLCFIAFPFRVLTILIEELDAMIFPGYVQKKVVITSFRSFGKEDWSRAQTYNAVLKTAIGILRVCSNSQ